MTPTQPQKNPVTYERLIDALFAESLRYKKSYKYALDHGISPRDIVDFALRKMTDARRNAFYGRLVDSPWAMNRVVALCKEHRRDPDLYNSLMERLGGLADAEHPDLHSAGCEILDEFSP